MKNIINAMVTVGGVQRKEKHGDLEQILKNDHRNYLETNTTIYNGFAVAVASDFVCRERDSGYYIPIISIASQDAVSITFNLQRTAIGLVDIIKHDDNGVKWIKRTVVGTQVTITSATQELIVASNTQYVDRNVTSIYADYGTALTTDFEVVGWNTGNLYTIDSFTSQTATNIVIKLTSTPIESITVRLIADNSIAWVNLTPNIDEITINRSLQSIHTNPLVADVNSATNIALDRIFKSSVDVIGMFNEDTTDMNYATNYLLTDNETIKSALEKFDVNITNKYKIVKNSTGGTLSQYKVVKVTGVNATYDATTIDVISAITDTPYGVVISDILDTEQVKILQEGILRIDNFNTSGASIGDTVYCDGAGNLTLTTTAIEVGKVLTLDLSGYVLFTIGSGSGGLGSRQYTNEYLLADNETITDSLDKLDSAFAYNYTIGHNNTGLTLSANSVVKITGENSGRATVGLISSYTDEIYGLVQGDILDGEYGRIIKSGVITTSIDTTLIPVNTFVYIDNTGSLTLTETPLIIGKTISQELTGKVYVDIFNYLYEEFYLEEYGFEAYQDFVTVPAQTIYTITEDANADTPYVITDLTKVVNNIDLFSVTDSAYKPIYKEGTIFKTATNMVVVSSYNPATGEVTLNGTPKTNFRINYTLKYNRKNVPDGKLILASNVQNIIEVPEEEEETTIQFDTSYNSPVTEGQLAWSADDGTLVVGMSGGASNSIGQELEFRATATENILNGQVVYISGSTGTNVRVSLVDASNFDEACKTIGVATENINTNQKGRITTFGLVRDIDTDAFTAGDEVYVDNNGNLTNVIPPVGSVIVKIGNVARKSATEGVLLVNVQVKDCMTTNKFSEENTGFYHPENIVVTYDSTARTITLTGTVIGYYQGKKVSALVSGWVSSDHPNSAGRYFLVYNGTAFQWLNLDTDTFDFAYLLIAFVNFNGTDFAIRECHGLMDWESHRLAHQAIGTYKITGGTIGDFTLNSTTATNRRPSITQTTLADEDLLSVLDALPSGTYTRHFLTASGTSNFTTGASDIVNLSTNQPYYNPLIGGFWQQSLLPNNAYMAVWILAIPTTADAGSKTYRYLFIQGQEQSMSLATIRAVSPQNVNLGELTSLTPESVFIGKIIIRYTGGNWTLTSVENLTGTRVNQNLSQASGTFLASVTTDTTLAGNGTVSTPLRMSGTFTPQADSINAYQFFKADGTTPILTFDTNNTNIYFNVSNSDFGNTSYFRIGDTTRSTYFGVNQRPSTYTPTGATNNNGTSGARDFRIITNGLGTKAGSTTGNILEYDGLNLILLESGYGRVGISTATPQREFHIHNPSLNSDTYLQITNDTTGDSSGSVGLVMGITSTEEVNFVNYSNTAMKFYTNGSERFRVSGDGTIYVSRNSEGINTAPTNTFMSFVGANGTTYRFNQDSFATFAVNSTRHADGVLSVKTNTKINNTLYKREAYGYGATGYTSGAVAGYRIIATENYTDSVNGSKILWYATPSGTSIANEALTYDGRILTLDGVALIGTTTEITRRKLYAYSNDGTGDVFIRNENASTTANTGAGIELRSGSTDFYLTSKYALGGYITMADNYPIILSTNNIERMRIYTDGQYDFGTDSAIKSSLWLKVDQLGRQPGIVWSVAGVKKSTLFVENEGTLGKTTIGRYDGSGNFVDRPFQMYHDTGDIYISQELNLSKSIRIGNNIATTAVSKTLALTDNGYLQKCTNASSINITVPPNSSVAFPIGTEIPFVQYGSGDVAFLAGAGVTINSESGKLKINGQYITAVLKKMGTDEWLLSGNLKA